MLAADVLASAFAFGALLLGQISDDTLSLALPPSLLRCARSVAPTCLGISKVKSLVLTLPIMPSSALPDSEQASGLPSPNTLWAQSETLNSERYRFILVRCMPGLTPYMCVYIREGDRVAQDNKKSNTPYKLSFSQTRRQKSSEGMGEAKEERAGKRTTI